MSDSVSRETPPTPGTAAGVFAEALETAEKYAELLAGPARVRGLMGPREVPRLWERHLLNCALVTDLIAPSATVCDVGSGAGLPGLVMAIRRPELHITLLEPLLRRTTFLEQAVTSLGLANVEVVRGRAEELRGTRAFDVVTSRAVAGMDRLLAWSLPLTEAGGVVLAMKGESAQQEVHDAAETIARLGGRNPEVLTLEHVGLSFPTTVVRVEAGRSGRIAWGTASSKGHKSPRRRSSKRQ
jgi:16S rRNA (guanine527-N7)-methyltransferase